MRILDVRADVTPIPWRRPAQSGRRRYTDPTIAAYREEVRWHMLRGRLVKAPTRERVRVSIVFQTNRGDVDNLAKEILDAGTGLAWEDDRQVRELHVYVISLPTGAKREPVRIVVETGFPEVPEELR